MRRRVKVADALCGVGYTRFYWTQRGVDQAVENLRREFGDAVWVLTPSEYRAEVAA